MGEMYESGAQKASEAKEGAPGMMGRVKESLETATHNIAESLEHAREKAREVFTGSQHPVGTTEVKVKTEPPAGTVNRVDIESNTETKIQ